MKFSISFLLLLAGCSCFAQLSAVQQNINHYTEKAQHYLDKEKKLGGYYSIDTNGISMYASAADKTVKRTEFFIAWDTLETFQQLLKVCTPDAAMNIYRSGSYKDSTPVLRSNDAIPAIAGRILPDERPLSGYRIAIDAGHIANDIATGELEKKHLKFKAATFGGTDSVEIAEGMLTYATATLLKRKLEAAGAQTFLTRVNGASAFGKTYQQWKKDDLKRTIDSLFTANRLTAAQKNFYLDPKTSDRTIFWDIFKDLELARRATLINYFQPDFTVIIHYNVDETNTGWTKPTTRNLDMTFVGGAFMHGDLASAEKRFEFFRLLVSDDFEKSVSLSSCVVNRFESTLNVPTAAISDAKYLREGCLATTSKGVYCRNLQLTRYVHSALVYGETLFQDNVNEAQALSKESDKTKNERVQQVAEAYYKGILDYINLKK